MTFRPLPTRRQAIFACAFVVLAALASAGLVTAALLAKAPPAVVPLIAATCVGIPVLASWDLPAALAVLRAGAAERARDARAVAQLRRHLDGLPETPHPHGF
ncbi:MAG: hypothetical protein ACXVFN_23330 [Solirubrobacteraceae bacterium]